MTVKGRVNNSSSWTLIYITGNRVSYIQRDPDTVVELGEVAITASKISFET